MEKRILLSGLRQRKNGDYEYRFSEEGKRYSVYGKSIEECLKKQSEKIQKLRTFNYSGEISLKDYYSSWEQARLGVVRDSTIGIQRAQFKTISGVPFETRTFGELLIGEISISDIRMLQHELSKRFSTNTTNQYVTLVKGILKSAVIERRIQYNPAEGVKQLRRVEEEARKTVHRALTKHETRKFMEAARGSHYYNFYKFLLNTGCRCGEAAAIRLEDVKGQTLSISRTVTRSETGSVIIGREPKTSSGRRTIPLRKEALEAVEDQCRKNKLMHPGFCLDGCIFCSTKGLLLYASAVDADIRKICARCGIRPFTSHAFRDTFATRAIESGMNPKTLQELLGHSDFSMTMNLYCHCMDSTKRKEIDRIDIG